jgi:YidC/Oxa1 family membrane protein insertase
MGCMTFGMPLFSTYFTFLFPVGIGIYWIASNVFAFAQTVLLSYTHNPKKTIAKLMIEEAIQRRSKEQNLKLVASRKEK